MPQRPRVKLKIPFDWECRGYQRKVWDAMDGGIKRACLVWHRRAGKDLWAINWCARSAFRRVGLYWHMLPTYAQGRKVVWEGKTKTGRPFLSHFPEQLVERSRDDEMRLWLRGGSQYQVVGADKPDSLVGANPVGIIFSEWSVMNPTVWDLMQPILAENGGWAIFIFTPRGHNFAFRTLQLARAAESWFSEVLSIEDTMAVSHAAVEEARIAGMTEEMILQEFYCSFDASAEGAYYVDAMKRIDASGRIGDVPWNPRRPVYTAWDLGVGDMTAIWFIQRIGPRWHLIDYEYGSGKGLEFYHKMLQAKPYAYADHLWPHDAGDTRGPQANSWESVATEMGLYVQVGDKPPSIKPGIDAVRGILANCKIDKVKCETGIESLRQYAKKELDIVGPNGEKLFSDDPVHSWYSHGADALRTFAEQEPDPEWGQMSDSVIAPETTIM